MKRVKDFHTHLEQLPSQMNKTMLQMNITNLHLNHKHLKKNVEPQCIQSGQVIFHTRREVGTVLHSSSKNSCTVIHVIIEMIFLFGRKDIFL